VKIKENYEYQRKVEELAKENERNKEKYRKSKNLSNSASFDNKFVGFSGIKSKYKNESQINL